MILYPEKSQIFIVNKQGQIKYYQKIYHLYASKKGMFMRIKNCEFFVTENFFVNKQKVKYSEA